MKYFLIFFGLIFFVYSCNTPKAAVDKATDVSNEKVADTIRIINEELEYEIIIIDIGFDSWLVTQKPMSYYSNNTLRIKNNFYVVEWNTRVNQPLVYNPSLYEFPIDYSPHIDYGIEVNYKLYMYFQFFQQKYKQRL